MSRLLIALLLLVVATTADGAAVTFPGSDRELRSPDSAYAIVWWGPDAGDRNHSLLLKAPYTRKTWRVYGFARSVTVSWAPREYIVAVTDHRSDEAATTVVLNVRTSRPVDVCAGPQQALGAEWTRAQRRYCEHVGWTERGDLRLRLWGSGSTGRFDRVVTVPMDAISW
jgi:hypothetical protein